MDLFLVHAYQDEEYASGLEDDLAGRGLVVNEPLSLLPGQRLLPQIDQRLHESRVLGSIGDIPQLPGVVGEVVESDRPTGWGVVEGVAVPSRRFPAE